jgi:hypothetical protein
MEQEACTPACAKTGVNCTPAGAKTGVRNDIVNAKAELCEAGLGFAKPGQSQMHKDPEKCTISKLAQQTPRLAPKPECIALRLGGRPPNIPVGLTFVGAPANMFNPNGPVAKLYVEKAAIHVRNAIASAALLEMAGVSTCIPVKLLGTSHYRLPASGSGR